MEKKSYRIRTTAGGDDKYLTLKLNQNYDYLEVLSVKINQENFYRDFTSDYGVLVGRVIANDGLGIPNANISIFIPLDIADSENIGVSSIYPYSDINEKDATGTSYNLLSPRVLPDGTKINVGSFPTKQQFLDDDTYLEVYEKYYKYTTKTNASGDYMIFGVPVGNQNIHMDLDLSDIGQYSFTPNDMISSGISEQFFIRTGNDVYDFAQSNELERLPQIVIQNTSVDIRPLWGNKEENEIGITRFDFKVSITANPIATFVFNYGIDKFAGGPSGFGQDNRRFMCYNGVGNGFTGNGINSEFAPGHANNVFPYINDGSGANYGEPELVVYKWDKTYTKSEQVDYVKIVRTVSTTNQGCVIAYLPCDQDKMITDEYGDIVKSTDDTKGIGTSGRYSMKVMLNGGNTPNTAYWNFVIQNNNQVDINRRFKFEANRIYSVSMKNMKNRDYPYALIATQDVNVVSYPNFNMGTNDWLNCFLYFGRVGNNEDRDSSEMSVPKNIMYTDGGVKYYNSETRFIDITDYFDILSDQVNEHYCEVGISDSRFTSITTTTQDNPANTNSQLPQVAPSRNNNRIFMLGIRNNINNFKSFKKNIKK